MYLVKDSTGHKVKNFKNMIEALNYKSIFGNKGWYIITVNRK